MGLAEQIQSRYPNLVLSTLTDKGDEVLCVKKEAIRSLCQALRKDPEFDFNMLMDLTAVDYLFWEEKADRYELVYNLHSLDKNHRLFLRVPLSESDASIESVVSVWPAANWLEREVWDMFGIVFQGHPNLKRILMYEGFEGHPLRKDYPYNKRQPLLGPLN